MKFRTLTATPDGDEVRVESLHGDPHLVAPVVMVREGVLNGGLLGYEEIQRSEPGWNGRPVTAPPDADASGHPVDDDGNFVSANRVEYLDAMQVGVIQGAEARNDLDTPNGEESPKGLRGEVWVNIRRAKAVGDAAIEAARRMAEGEELEVSTGYYHDATARSGTFNGERYEAEQFDLMPDHLALLPNETGACSWADGCGAPRANVDAPTAMSVNETLGSRVLAVNADDGDGDGGQDDGPKGTLQRIRDLVTGDGADDGAANATGCGTCDHGTMNDEDLKALAEATEFDLETLKDMDDGALSALSDTVEADGGDDGGDGGADDDPDAQNTGGDADAGGASDEVEALREQVETLTDTVEELNEQANRDPEAEAARDALAENTDHSREDLADWPDSAVLEAATARGLTGQGYSAPQGNRVNRLGQAGANTDGPESDDEDVEGYVGNSGALKQLDAAEQGAD